MRKSCAFGLSLLLISSAVCARDARAASPAGDEPRHARPGAIAALARWTEPTPEAMILQSSRRPSLAAVATVAALADRAALGMATRALDVMSESTKLAADERAQAALVGRTIAADEGLESGEPKDRALGVLTHMAIVGPFRDTGGGLDRKEGPEAATWGDGKARWPWGTVDVSWRAAPTSFATARGVPLDVLIAPRKESCSYVASRVTLDAARAIVVHAAATGSVRFGIDAVTLGKSDDVHESMLFDRLAAKVDAPAGAHVVWAKVCSGALDDDGRVRLRVTGEKGEAIPNLADAWDLSGAQETAKPKATPVETWLGRTLAGKSFDGIVARTLGGADDLRSPRAPGLLDVYVRAATDPDQLAFAAWITPAGANRSGWLRMARERAAAAKDAQTVAFVERREIAEHLQARMADWAMAESRRALATATDNEAVLLRAMVQAALGTDVLRLDAMHAVAAMIKGAADSAPTAALEELAELAHGFDPKLEETARQALARRGRRDASLVEAVAQTQNADAVAAVARAAFESGGVESVEDGVAIAQAVAHAGKHDVARSLAQTLAAWAPNRAESWGLLAEEMAVSPKRPEGQKVVLFALSRARDLAPGEARYRAELALRTGKLASEAGAAQDDERHLVPSQTILARRLGVPKVPDSADRELHWLRAVVMHPDRRVSQLIHYAREIVISPRTQDELVEEVPAEGDTTEILRARVHRKDGGTAFPLEERNEGARPRIRWPELEPGDVVEVAIRTWTEHPVGGRGDPPFYFLDYAGATSTHPLLYNEVVVEAPPQVPIHLDVLHADPSTYKREEKDDNGRHVVRLVWDRPVVVPEEPLSPAMSEVVPLIIGSTFKSWADFRSWYAEAVKGFTEPDEEVKHLAAELTKGKTTREAKLAALFDFVADDIRYVNFVSGEAWLPNRPQQLLARRVGDCDDKAILLITLLKAVGIDAQEVMVQTRETGQPSVLMAKNAAAPLFDHGIAFLPGPNGGQYLDATSPQSRLGPVPSMDARAVALRLDSGPAEIVSLPPSSPDDHGSDVTWNVTLKDDGSGDLSGEEVHSGDQAFYLRTYMTEAQARAQYVEDALVSPWFSSVEVDKKVDFDGELRLGRAKVGYKAHSDALARIEQGELVVPLSQSATLASVLAPLVKRTLPVVLPPQLAPSHQARTVRVTAPAGFEWGALPPGGEENGGEFGRAKLDVSVDPKNPRVVVIKRTVVFDQHQIGVDKYPAWRAFIQRVDALMHKSVRAVPAKRGAK